MKLLHKNDGWGTGWDIKFKINLEAKKKFCYISRLEFQDRISTTNKLSHYVCSVTLELFANIKHRELQLCYILINLGKTKALIMDGKKIQMFVKRHLATETHSLIENTIF